MMSITCNFLLSPLLLCILCTWIIEDSKVLMYFLALLIIDGTKLRADLAQNLNTLCEPFFVGW